MQLTVTSLCSLKMYSWHSAAAAPPSTEQTAQTCSINILAFDGDLIFTVLESEEFIHLLLVVVQTLALMNFIVYCTLYRGWVGK